MLFFFVGGNNELTAQYLYSEREAPSNIPSRYLIDAEDLYEETLKKRDGEKKKLFDQFAEVNSYGKKKRMESGIIYMNWFRLEDYLTDLKNRVLPDGVSQDEVDVYINRDPTSNAFCIFDGTLFFNIGLLAEAHNEAEMAFIMGHEISHYIKRDVRKAFFETAELRKAKNRDDIGRTEVIQQADYSQSQEIEADSFASEYVHAAGYSIREAKNYFYNASLKAKKSEEYSNINNNPAITVLSTSDPQDSIKRTDVLSRLLSTHPDNKERIEQIERAAQRLQSKEGGSKYIISKEKFLEFRKEARIEKLELELKKHDFRNCMENALIYFLEEDNDPRFMHFLLEAMRRRMYVDKSFGDQGFLSDRFAAIQLDTVNILKHLEFLILNEERLAEINSNEFVKTYRDSFNTYLEAFNVLERYLVRLDHRPAYLTFALYHYQNKKLSNKYFSGYEDPRNKKVYKDYIKTARSRSLDRRTGRNGLIVINDIGFLEDRNLGYHRRYRKAKSKRDKFVRRGTNFIDERYRKKEVVGLDDLKDGMFDKYKNYNELMKTAFYLDDYLNYDVDAEEDKEVDETITTANVYTFKGSEVDFQRSTIDIDRPDNSDSTLMKPFNMFDQDENFNLFIFNPYYWVIFKDNDLESIEFFSALQYKDRRASSVILRYYSYVMWLIPPYALYYQWFAGSKAYGYNVKYYGLKPFLKKEIEKRALRKGDNVNYKLHSLNFVNSIYYILDKTEELK